MSNDKGKINHVRQILMNELGFTKETVREEMRRIVEAEAAKVMSSLISQGHLERLVSEQFHKALSQSKWARPTIYEVVRAEAAKQAKALFENRLSISIDGNHLPSEVLPKDVEMTTDREMLEFAAKAIGHTLYWTGNEGCGDSFIYFGPDISNWTPFSGHDKFELGETKRWNPITSSADCAAMGAKLGIDTTWFYESGGCGSLSLGNMIKIGYVDHNNDPEAAWRFAATMVAAKIGGMK